MSFGKKGLAPGQAAPPPGGGFGRAEATGAALSPEAAEIAAKREAFLAQERARQAQAQEAARAAEAADPMASLRNDARPKHNSQARAASPLGMGVAGAGAGAGMGAGALGASGMSAAQEAEIRAAARGMAGGGPARSTSSGASSFVFGDPAGRSVGLAYVLWFILGQFSLHRFYCGQKDTALIQMGMWMGSLIMLFIFPPFGFIGLALWLCWLIGDLFMIPGMLRKFQEEHNYTGVFT